MSESALEQAIPVSILESVEAPPFNERVLDGTQAVLAWLRAIGAKPGTAAAPPCSALLAACERWCDGRYHPTLRDMPRALARLGCGVRAWGTVRRWRVSSETARVMREAARAAGWAPKRRHGAVRRSPFRSLESAGPAWRVDWWTARAKALHPQWDRPALYDSLQRVWPSASVAARERGKKSPTSAGHLVRRLLAAERAGSVEGCEWEGLRYRRLTAAEEALVPRGALAGDRLVLPWVPSAPPHWEDGGGL